MTEDEDAAGSVKTLSNSEGWEADGADPAAPQKYTKSQEFTTALGLATAYHRTDDPDADVTSSVTNPDGTETVTAADHAGVSTTTTPDGTVSDLPQPSGPPKLETVVVFDHAALA